MTTATAWAPFELEIFDEHVQEASFLWSMREDASRDPRYDLDSLCRVDARLEARLDALLVAGEAGMSAARDALRFPDAGTAFAAAVVALESDDRQGFAAVLDSLHRASEGIPAVASALGWVSPDALERVLPGLLAPDLPSEMRYVAIAGCALQRRDPGQALSAALGSPDDRLRARALLAAGELGRTDLRPRVRDALSDDDEACQFAAGYAGLLLGEPEATLALRDLAEQRGLFAERACSMAVRRMPVDTARPWLQELFSAPGGDRAALRGCAALGDAEMVPWLIERMNDLPLARLCAGALWTITGVDPRAEGLEGKAPEDFLSGPTDDPADEDVAMDPDDALPWLDVTAVRRWWSRARGGFSGGGRRLAGRPLTAERLSDLLRTGHQLVRAAAAMELCLSGKARGLFEVRARGSRQRQALPQGGAAQV
ncbi:MAG: TIGR02270 family protein [Polyangiaceae bacterium]